MAQSLMVPILWQAFDRLETLEHTARIAILARILGGSKNLPADAIEKLINVREAAGYLGEGARCQACGYLHETQLACPTGDRPRRDRLSTRTSSSEWLRKDFADQRRAGGIVDSGSDSEYKIVNRIVNSSKCQQTDR